MIDTTRARDGGRSALIASALDLLDDTHPEDLSIREVARRAGLSSGAPYHHFADKTELLAACAAVAWEQLGEQLDAEVGGNVEKRLTARAAAYLAFARAHRGAYALITSRLLEDENRFGEIVVLRGRAMRGVIELILAADERGDAAAAKFRAMAMWSLLHGHVTLSPELPADALAAHDRSVAMLAARLALLAD